MKDQSWLKRLLSWRRSTARQPAQADLGSPLLKNRLGEFQLEPFAVGGVCEVSKGVPLNPENPTLAVKMILPEWFDNPAVRKQFTHESQIVRELRNSSLPQYVSRGLYQGKPYYAYQLIEGEPLIRLWQDRDLMPPARIMRQISAELIKQLLMQLRYLHRPPLAIVHGDISSENIVFDRNYKLHLLDFGCAHFQQTANQESYKWLAKPSFITPEQARGDNWDYRSDLYQAGILFYELVTGKRWNRGSNQRDKILYAASAETQKEDFLVDRVDIRLSRLIAHMLHPDPNQRLQTANRGIQLIEEYQASNAGQAPN